MSNWNPLLPITSAADKNRVFGLDLLRAIAILLVLYGHAILLFPQHIQALLFRFLIFDPVTLFFVLSGFLIGRILINVFTFETLNFKTFFKFWIRRWMRTIPAYLATLFLLACVYHQFSFTFLLRYVFFVQNFNWNHPQWFPEAWSLSIEEWFYFLIPLLLVFTMTLLKSGVRNTFLFTCLAIMICAPFYRWYKYEATPFTGRTEWDYLFRMQVLTRLDSIMYGVFGAYLYRFHAQVWAFNRKLLLTAGLTLMVIAYFYNHSHVGREAYYSSVWSFSMESFAVLLTLPFFAGLKTVKGKLARLITMISIISYSLYLLNMSFVSSYVCNVIPHLNLTGLPWMAYKVLVYFFTTLISSIILYLTVEHPFMVLRDRITQEKTVNFTSVSS